MTSTRRASSGSGGASGVRRLKPSFAVLLINDRDRLGREHLETGYIFKKLLQAGVRIFETKTGGREITQRSFELPEGIDAAQVEAKHANGMLEVRVPAPRAAMPTMIEIKAA